MSHLAYGVCVGSWDRFNRYVAPKTEGREVVALSGQTSIATAYNRILGALWSEAIPHGRLHGVVLQHDDLEILDPARAEAVILEAFQDPEVALVGVAGGDASTGLAWWNMNPVGHQLTDSTNIDFGQRTGDVALLEGSLLALSPWAMEHLSFDENYPGFHGYDEIAMEAQSQDKRVVVVDVDTHHHSTLGFESLASYEQWLQADQRFRKKWGL